MMHFALVVLAPSVTDPSYDVSIYHLPCKVMCALLIVCPRSFSRLGTNNRVWLSTLLALSWTRFSRRKHVSRELGSGVPSSATQLTRHTQAESGLYLIHY